MVVSHGHRRTSGRAAGRWGPPGCRRPGEIEEEVSNANITIIEGIGASQYGIGIVSARLAEAILRDEGCVFPVGSYHERYRVTLSLPSVIGHQGALRTLTPQMSEQERRGLERSAQVLRDALDGASR